MSKIIKMVAIKQEIAERLKANSKAKARLAYEFDVNPKTIERWLENEGNYVVLTTPIAVNAIAEELQVKATEVLAKA